MNKRLPVCVAEQQNKSPRRINQNLALPPPRLNRLKHEEIPLSTAPSFRLLSTINLPLRDSHDTGKYISSLAT